MVIMLEQSLVRNCDDVGSLAVTLAGAALRKERDERDRVLAPIQPSRRCTIDIIVSLERWGISGLGVCIKGRPSHPD